MRRPPAAFTTWNPSDKNASITLSNGNRTGTNNTGGAHAGVRSIASRSTGKYYYEIYANVQTFTGFSYFGVANSTASLSNYLGVDANAAIMTGGGGAVCNGASIGTGDGLANTQTMGIAVDFTALKIWFWNNVTARWNGDILANQNPSNGTGGFSIAALAAGPYFPAMSIYQLNDQFTANFGATAYLNTAPTGFGNW